ncbi:MAG TPA: CoA transferase, partial [Caulobacteraceae bacterium]|nr:CoA transferase [Caulobacteraceae bacterium]
HLIRTADGWIALNLARDDDQSLVPAWLRIDPEPDHWAAIHRCARERTSEDLIADAILLGLPAGRVGEVRADANSPPRLRLGDGAPRRSRPLRIVDLSALWAGPMCGAILAAMGAEVLKIESAGRPDPTRATMPEFFRRLNGAKQELVLDFTDPRGRSRLRQVFAAADIVITSARPRAFAALELDPDAIFAVNPDLVWVAITGYGWIGAAAERVAFGDDAAAAGGLVRWTPDGEPRFLGDALADPVTGLTAAIGALEGLAAGGGVLVDVAMARCAAVAASICGLAPGP